MHAQQIKCAESIFGKSNYMWLCSKRTPVIWMSTKDEFLIRQALTKVKFLLLLRVYSSGIEF